MSDPVVPAPYVLRSATWQEDQSDLMFIRRRVFVEEQGIPESEEMDDRDALCRHALAIGADGSAVGTGRLDPKGKIGRIAVLPPNRRSGIGAAIVRHLVNQATELGLAQVYLHAQADSVGFYERLGFVAEGPIFDEVGIPHRRMRRGVGPSDGQQTGRDRDEEHPHHAR